MYAILILKHANGSRKAAKVQLKLWKPLLWIPSMDSFTYHWYRWNVGNPLCWLCGQ